MSDNAESESDAEFLTECKQVLENYACFGNPETFVAVFSTAKGLVERYNGTPDTLHLYLNALTDKSGQRLGDTELVFLYLQILRYFSVYALPEITPDGTRRIYHGEWHEKLISCLPCPCDPSAIVCECDLMERDKDVTCEAERYDWTARRDVNCKCHWSPYRNLILLIYPDTNWDDFDLLKRRLELLPDTRERIRLLISEKTEFEQTFGPENEVKDESSGITWVGFSAKCELEIAKYRQLSELESSPTGPLPQPAIPAAFYDYATKQVTYLSQLQSLERDHPEASESAKTYGGNDQYDPAKRGLTRQLAMLLIDELFPNLKDASNTAKAEFLSFLTGFDADGLRNKWSDYRLGNKNTIEADLKKVAAWKTKLKISD